MNRTFEALYLETLRRVDPAERVAERWKHQPHEGSVILLGKCARRMAEGLARAGWRGDGLAIVPRGYEGKGSWPPGFDVRPGSHPMMDDSSFAAGETLHSFVAALEGPALVLISGGASASVERPVEGVSAGEIIAVNQLLVRSGIAIDRINSVRKHLSSIKGGRLASLLPRGSRSWIWSDVPPGRAEVVGSGPTSGDPTSLEDAAAVLEDLGDPLARGLAKRLRSGEIPETPFNVSIETELLADNHTLLETAAAIAGERGLDTLVDLRQLDEDVESVAAEIVTGLLRLSPGTVAIRGGEPTVTVRGEGKGGRCSEVILRVLCLAEQRGLSSFSLLVGSSDGIDGNSGTAAYLVEGGTKVGGRIGWALASSDAHPLAAEAGRAIVTGATGNNLRDIILMARG